MTAAPPRATVLVCDDDARIRDALREAIAAQPDLAVAAVACNHDEAVDLAERLTPTLAIIDVRMPGGGARATRDILRTCPDTRVLAFSAHDDPGAIREMHQAGALEYLVKGAPLREILGTLRRLAHTSP